MQQPISFEFFPPATPKMEATLNYSTSLTGRQTNPLYDGPGQITSLLAATIVHEVLSLLAAGRSA